MFFQSILTTRILVYTYFLLQIGMNATDPYKWIDDSPMNWMPTWESGQPSNDKGTICNQRHADITGIDKINLFFFVLRF